MPAPSLVTAFGRIARFNAILEGNNRTEGVGGQLVSGEFFSVLRLYPVLGRLWIGGYLKTGAKTFYCPSQGDNQFRFNAPNNPWPPPGPFTVHTRAGYTSRPTIPWNGDDPVGPMTRLSKLRNKAMLADIVGIPGFTPESTTVHRFGLNVLFNDRSARPVDKRFLRADPEDHPAAPAVQQLGGADALHRHRQPGQHHRHLEQLRSTVGYCG